MTVKTAVRSHVPQPILTWRHRRHQQRVVRRRGLDRAGAEYIAEHGTTVQTGPFRGLTFPETAVEWEQLALIPWLRGSYEREIARFLSTHTALRPGSLFVDLGCAEGPYLVGMARLGHPAIGFEIDPVRRERARNLAGFNDVVVDVRGAFSPDGLDFGGALVLIDIEGAERDLIATHRARFATARLIIEFHGGSERDVIALLDRTHEALTVPFEGRSDPLEDEHRSDGQLWGVFEPREEPQPTR